MSVKGRSPELRSIKPLIEFVLHCGSTIIRGVARKIPEVNKKSQNFSSPCMVALLFHCYLTTAQCDRNSILKKKNIQKQKHVKDKKIIQNSVYHSQMNT